MSDPIEKLTRLGDALEDAPMPLPASEIRARGDRIRRRRNAAVAGVSAAVVAAVAVPLLALTVADDDKADPDRFTPSPTVTDTAPVPALELSEANLLTDEQAIYPNGGSDWVVRDTYPGDGQAPYSPCTQTSMEGLGATLVFQRDFDFVVTDTGDVEPTLRLNEIVAEFPDTETAKGAFALIQEWYGEDCLPAGYETYGPGEIQALEVPVGSGATQVSTYGPIDEAIDPFGDSVWFLETGFVLTGDRIAVLTQVTHGQDYIWPEGTPVEQMLPDVATQLALGNTPTQPPTEQTDVPGGFIPADFPLAAGWPETAGDGPGLEGPSTTLPSLEFSACDAWFSDPRYIDRLRANWSDAEDFRARQLTMYSDVGAAGAATEELVDLFRSCPTGPVRDDGYRTDYEVVPVDAGDSTDEAWAILQRDTLDGSPSPFGSTTVIIRVATAVLVLDHGGHAGYPSGDGQEGITSLLEEAAEPISALPGLQERLDDGATDPDADGPATSIPAGFPLDLALGEPPVADGETTVEGPSADAQGARPQTMCGGGLAFPNFASTDVDEPDLAYTVSSVEGYEGRTLRVYPSAAEASARMEVLRGQVQGCDRDRSEGGQSDRLWRIFNSDTGYDSITFGYTYEVVDGAGAPAGQLYTVMRVGNAILAIEYGGEYSAQFQAQAAPDQVDLAQLIADEMCIFTEAGC